jgi:hypothetical protein
MRFWAQLSLRALVFVSSLMSATAYAISREDVLTCGLPDGNSFILRSKYEWSMIPLPTLHSSRETKRQSWGAEYIDSSGRKSQVPASVGYSGKTSPQQLDAVCAHFGMIRGTPLAPFTFPMKNGRWYPLDNFPWKQLTVDFRVDLYPLPGVNSKPNRLSAAQRAEMDKAGIHGSTYLFAYIYSEGDRLVYEQPLHRSNTGYQFEKTFDAVYQAFSTDAGKTWSNPIVSTDARIFELGKSWLQQSFIARPTKINGKRL